MRSQQEKREHEGTQEKEAAKSWIPEKAGGSRTQAPGGRAAEVPFPVNERQEAKDGERQ